SEEDVLRAGVLGLAAALHIGLTSAPVERRRAVLRQGSQDDLWLFTSVLVVPLPLSLLLLTAIRAHRYFVARQPPHTFLFTSSAIALSILCEDAIATATPLRSWMTSAAPLPDQPVGLALSAAAAATAITGYYAGQTIAIGVARGLHAGRWAPADVLGRSSDNTAMLAVLSLAVGLAVLQTLDPPLVLLLVPVAVRLARTEQRLRSVEAARDRLKAAALHDPLTGLLNRRGFEPDARVVLLHSERLGNPTALLFVDIDHFKGWNERLGHLGGDQLLKAVAGILRRETRHDDLMCRWGGEEIVVLLRDTTSDQAWEVAERIRVAVQEVRIPWEPPTYGEPVHTDVPHCTVSVGIAVARQGLSDLDELARRANKALFQPGPIRVAVGSGLARVRGTKLADTRPSHSPACSGEVPCPRRS
ncbi:MAG: GGDEF domain-containing protein, partial [Saccharothrix sp.]|nr:GGDEF domain-containing protein [Saccharothrix sp.]